MKPGFGALLACFNGGKNSSTQSKLPITNTNNETEETEETEEDDLQPVVVELFSSQGCAKSPEAEMFISRLGRGDFQLDVPIIVLAFHVDYWDHIGWRDPFGSNQWTVRQKNYVEALKLDQLYTPQLVVQGQVSCMGNEEDVVLGHITEAARFPAPALKASYQKASADSMNLKITLKGSLSVTIDSEEADVMVALYENCLVTDCPEGENRGRILANDYVVRRLKKLCTVREISAETIIAGSVTFALWEGFNSSKCGMVVFLQNRSFQILGSKKFKLSKNI